MAAEQELEKLAVRLIADGQQYFRVLDQAAQKASTTVAQITRQFGAMATQMSAQMTAVGRSMTIGITAPLTALAGGMVKAASDAEETRSKFSVVFSSIMKDANAAANELDKSYGLAGTEARKLLSDTGDLLTGFGFSQKAALDLSRQVQTLAVDLASFTNVEGGAKRASDALTKALLGEREMVKSLGIAILDEDVKKQVALNVTRGLTFETERQAKAFATLQLAQQQSKNAIGDYARTFDSAANQFREFQSDTKDLAESFGRLLLPAAKELLATIRSGVSYFNNLSTAAKENIISMGKLLAVIGPTSWAIGLGPTFDRTYLKAMEAARAELHKDTLQKDADKFAKMQQRAADVIAANVTPQEEMAKLEQELNGLVDERLLTQEQATKELERQAKQLFEVRDVHRQIAQFGTEGLDARSAEARAFVQQFVANQQRQLQKQPQPINARQEPQVARREVDRREQREPHDQQKLVLLNRIATAVEALLEKDTLLLEAADIV